MASSCTSTLQYPSLHLYPVSEKFLCSVLPTPPSSLICIASVGWYNIMSVGEGMACLSAPGGLPTHSLKEKAIQSEYHPTLPFPCFLSLYTIAPRLCGTALFVFAHTPTNAQRVMVRTKAGRGACKSVFSPIIRLLYQTHKEHGLHVYLPFLALLKLSLSLPHSATLFLQKQI